MVPQSLRQTYLQARIRAIGTSLKAGANDCSYGAHMRAVLAALTLFATASLPAMAQERCDCSPTQRSAACEASVQHREGVVAISSSSPACSMVLWTADGQPNVTLVTDGLDIFDWLGGANPTVAVERCEVCLDRELGLGGAVDLGTGAGPVNVSEIRPETGIDFTPPVPAPSTTAAPAVGDCPGGSPAPELIVPAKLDYPKAMERYAMNGTCQVLFDIAESGAAMNIRPTCSHDGFTDEAARAVTVVRFSPPYHCGKPVVRKDVVYPLVFRFSAKDRPVPSMAPIPNGAGE